MKRKILVIVESLDMEDSSGSKANVALIQNLHKIGFDLLVYHYTRKEIYLPPIKTISIKEHRRSFLFFLSRVERFFRNILNLNLSKPLEKIFGFSFTLFNDRDSIVSALREIKNYDPHLVITLSVAGRFRPHHALLKLPYLHKKWIAYIHDPYPMHLYPRPFAWVEAGYFKKWEFILNVSEKAAYSAFPSKLLKEWMGSYFPEFLNTGIVIPHQIIDLNLKNVNFPEYYKREKFTLLHSGSLLKPRNPTFLVLAFQRFLERHPDARECSNLILIGSGSLYSTWLEMKEKEMKELEINNKLPFPIVFKMQQNAAVNIILEAKSEISPFLPGKFPHCVQADKPILLLGPNYSECRRLLGNDYPFWSEIDDINKISILIENLFLEWKRTNGLLNLNRPDLVNYLSRPYLEQTLEGILSNEKLQDK